MFTYIGDIIMVTKDKIYAFQVTIRDDSPKVKKIEYTFAQMKEAIMFQVGMKKKGYETNLTRVEL